MLNKIKFLYYQKKLVEVYTKNIQEHGFNPEGLFWNSIYSQHKRFSIFFEYLKKLNINKPLIADVGCGYGEFFRYLKLQKFHNFIYYGYDINSTFIEQCKLKFRSDNFFVNNYPTMECDICLMSGTYNLSISNNYENWESYVFENLIECFNQTSKIMCFNLQFSSKKQIKNKIFYVNVEEMDEKLRKIFSNVEFFFSKDLKNDVFFTIKK